MSKILKITIILGIITISFLIGYQSLVTFPKIEKNNNEILTELKKIQRNSDDIRIEVKDMNPNKSPFKSPY